MVVNGEINSLESTVVNGEMNSPESSLYIDLRPPIIDFKTSMNKNIMATLLFLLLNMC